MITHSKFIRWLRAHDPELLEMWEDAQRRYVYNGGD